MSWDCNEIAPIIGLVLESIRYYDGDSCDTIVPNSDLQTLRGFIPNE